MNTSAAAAAAATVELDTLVSSIHALRTIKPILWKMALDKHASQIADYKNKFGLTPTPTRS